MRTSDVMPHAASAESPPALLLGGGANALSAARALARRSVEVHAFGPSAGPVRWSRAIAGFTDVGLGPAAQDRTLELLSTGRSGGVLIPCSDESLELVVDEWDRLLEWGYRLPEIDPGLARRLLDKEATYALSREIGVAAPHTIVPDETLDPAAVLSRLGTPCAIKPRRSEPNLEQGEVLGKGIIVWAVEDLERGLRTAREASWPVVLTEIVPGPDRNLFSHWTYVDGDGRLLFEMTKQKLRQHPIGFGTGCHAVTGWDEEIAEIGRRFAQGVGLLGYAATEFKRHADTGELVVIESNYRLVDANEQARAAGIDVAAIVYERALGRHVPSQPPARDGVHFWHPVRDFRSYRSLRRSGDASLASWLKNGLRRPKTPYFSAADPRPSVMLAARALRQMVVYGSIKAISVLRMMT